MIEEVKNYLLSKFEEDNREAEKAAEEIQNKDGESDVNEKSQTDDISSGSLTGLLLQIEKRKKIRKTELSDREKFQKELLMYEDGNNISSANDPLAWWHEHQVTFPRLSKYARMYLSIPATSCSSERLFSWAGMISTKSRNRLHPKTVNQMLFLNRNLEL
ncbi:hypothetical protein SNE40_008875 [Patella caerulea]|uniref:HAT C-terminal dimerisation domain-containing protein n=1 Tax=Patella caerulea TaxID=87958 RepID=A0AAN8JR24_PATCE